MSAELPALGQGDVVVLGDVMQDIIVFADGPLVRGSDQTARIEAHAGGSGANQAVWLAHDGVPVRFIARVGHADAARLEHEFEALGVRAQITGDEQAQTGRLITLVDADAERSFFTDRGANLLLSAADLGDNVLDGANLVIISGYAFFAPGPRAAARLLVDQAGDRGCPVLVDAASEGFLRQMGREAFIEATRGVFGLVANSAEAGFLSGEPDLAAQIAVLGALYPMVVIKAGADGAVGRLDPCAPVEAKGLSAKVVDSTGAGDAFLAGLVAAWRQGKSLSDALGSGNRAGAKAVARAGGRPPV